MSSCEKVRGRRAEDAQGAVGAVAALDQDAHAADDPVVAQQGRDGEPRLGAEVLDDDRLVGLEGEAGQRGGPDPDGRVVLGVRAPPHAGPRAERRAVGGQLHDPAELDLQVPRGQGHGLVQQRGQVDARQGPLPQRGHDRLLPRPLAHLLLGPDALGDGPGQLLGLLRQRLGVLPLPRRLLAEPLQLPAALLLGQLAPVLPALVLVQLGRLPLDLLGLLEQLDEDRDLRAEHRRHDRLGQEVDRPQRVAPG